MIIAETDPVLVKMIREKDMGAIIKWFDLRKESLYKLACSYLKSPEAIQEVFYNVIVKVHTDIRKQKQNPYFENWVLSLFLRECKEVNLHGFQGELDDALILTYVLGLSHDKVARILEIPTETVKERLYKGIQNISGVDEGHNQEKFIDYLSRTLERPEKIELEIHIHTCRSCQLGLTAFQDSILSLVEEANAIKVPANFLENVITRVNKMQELKRKKKKKRTNIGLVITSSLVLLLLVGYVTNGFNYIYYSWLDWRDKEDEQLLAYLKNGLGEPLNLVQESNGIKVTIKSVIADDYQTLIFYEVENLESAEQYGINFWNGVFAEDEMRTFDQHSIPINQLPVQPLESEGDIFKGTISLLPVTPKTETIKLNISKLQKMEKDIETSVWIDPYGEGAFTTGEWNFEIPVKKQASIEHVVDEKITVEGVKIGVEKLILAPTMTVLQYHFEPYNNNKNINELFFEGIKTKDKTAKPVLFGWNYPIQNSSWQYFTFQSVFDSLYFEDPKEVKILLSSMSYFKSDFYKADIAMNQPFPQTFDYLGSEISIDKIELGTTTKIELTAEMSEGRKFESIHYEILGRNDGMPIPMVRMDDVEGVLVDRNGKIYNRDDYDFYANMDEIERPRHYQTKILIEVHNEVADEEIVPGWLQINGFQGTTYLDDEINIKLK